MKTTKPTFYRHDLLKVKDTVQGQLEGEAGRLWRQYSAVPLIYTRQDGWEELPEAGLIRCGLSLPIKENGTRKRFALCIRPEDILSAQSPFEVADSLTGDDGRIGALLSRLRTISPVRIGIFGSAALEWVSGYRYLTDVSDVDMIVEGKSREALYHFYHLLPELEHLCQARLDVEVRFPGGRDARLREMFSAETRVVVKSAENADLVSKEELWNSIAFGE